MKGKEQMTKKNNQSEKKIKKAEEIESNIKESNTKENNIKRNFLYVGIVIFIIALIIAIFIALKNVGLINFDNPIKKRAELNYTTPTDKQKEGVYITDVSEVVEEVMPSIVSITSKTLVTSGMFGPSFWGQEQYSEGAGSGIIISKTDEELLILTNNHVVEGAKELSVQFVNEKSVDAKIKGQSPRKDIAVISLNLKDLDNETLEKIKIATIGDSDTLKVGNGIIAIGNALGYGQSVTTGVVSAIDRVVEVEDTKNKMIQIDAAINGGNSGGALLNSRGEVVGINSVKYSSNGSNSSASIEGMGFAIPITDVKDLITSLMNGEEDISDATIGVEGYMVTEELSNAYGLPIGFYIQKTTPGSGAEKAKLEKGDIITEIEGKKVESLEDIQDVIYDKRKGDQVKLKISYPNGRNYEIKDVTVTLS